MGMGTWGRDEMSGAGGQTKDLIQEKTSDQTQAGCLAVPQILLSSLP